MSSRSYGGPPAYSTGSASGPEVSPVEPPIHFHSSGYSGHSASSSRQVSPERQAPPPPRHATSGIAGPAVGGSNQQPSTSGHHGLRDMDNLYGSHRMSSPSRDRGPYGLAESEYRGQGTPSPGPRAHNRLANSQSSITPLMAMQPPSPPRPGSIGRPLSGYRTPDFEQHMPRSSYYHGDGYDDFDPHDIADDGDDGLEEHSRPRDSHMASAVGAGAGAGTAAGFMKAIGRRPADNNYNPVTRGQDPEKSDWLQGQSSGNKRMKWLVGSLVVLILIGAIVGGVVGGVLSSKHSKSNTSSGSSSGGSSSGGDSNSGIWNINSPQIKAVLNNKNLHKVFPGMDYTPFNAQYPACLSNPLDQNNVTLDMAILSQLTPAVRLYGTDCNQTEMVLAGIDNLGYNSSMTVWLGVYLGTNDTTNVRQVAQMWDILDNNPASRFAGIILGNEAIFEGGMSASQLETELDSIRSNLTAKGINIPLATSQLGDDWTTYPDLVSHTDIVMSNVHPFFAGQTAEEGASWAWTFWQGNDFPLTTSDSTGTINGTSTTYPKQIISEIGWPSQGGQDCGDANSASYGCTGDLSVGAVANMTNLNTFMDTWVCAAMANTTYFWFEAFDEPWKHQFDTQYDKWEPYWGLFDEYRNLKTGIQIPDCGGKTVSNPYGP